MVTSPQLVPFALTAFALIVVPGPSVLFVIGRGVALGRRVALATVVGNAAGVYLQVVAVAIGLGAVVTRSVAVFTIVKLGGAGYLAWLGVQAIRHRRDHPAVAPGGPAPRGRPVPLARAVRDGFVVGVGNPKAIVFFSAILPQFVDPALGAVPVQMLVLGLVFVAVALVSDGAWGLLAGSARRWFATSDRRLERLTTLGGATMIGLAVALAAAGRDR